MTKEEKYEAKRVKLQEKIRELIKSGKAQLGFGILHLLKIKKSPAETILENIKDPDLKLMDLEHILKSLCSHEVWVKSDDSGKCSVCGTFSDWWWCDQSPDNRCYYFSEEKNGKQVITLENGVIVPLPDGHDPEYETDDDCLFCHQPDERK